MTTSHRDRGGRRAGGALLSLLLVTAAVAVTAACDRAPRPDAETPPAPAGPTVTVRFEDAETTFVPTDALVTTFEKGLVVATAAIGDAGQRPQAVVHRIFLADYDLGLTQPGDYKVRPLGGEGTVRVELQIEDREGAAPGTPLRPGTYTFADEPYDRLSWVTIARPREGRDSGTFLAGEQAAGTVTIDSVDGGVVAGRLDVRDEDGSVVGTFTARTLG